MSKRWASVNFARKRLAVRAAWGFRCAYCDGDARTVDHVVPVSKAPELQCQVGNLVAACKPCNRAKGIKSLEEFLQHDTDRIARIRQWADMHAQAYERFEQWRAQDRAEYLASKAAPLAA